MMSGASAGSGGVASAKLLQTDTMHQRTMVPALAANGYTYVLTVGGSNSRGSVEFQQLGATGYIPRSKMVRATNEGNTTNPKTDEHAVQEVLQLTTGHLVGSHSQHQDGIGSRLAITQSPLDANGTAIDKLRSEVVIPVPATFSTRSYGTAATGFSTGDFLHFGRAENATNSSWFLSRATETAILANTIASPTAWTAVEIVRTTITERGYFWMTKDPLNADTCWVYGVKSTGSNSGLYCFKIVWTGAAWVARDYANNNLTLPIDPATQLTGRSVIASVTGNQTFVAEHGQVGTDGRLRVLGAEAPNGWGVANSQADLQYSYFYDDGTTWRKVVIVSGQGSLADAPAQMAGGSLKAGTPNQVLLGVGGVGVNKEIQHWTVNEGTQTASKTRDLTTGSSVSRFRPHWVKNGTTALECIWAKRNAFPNFDDFEGDLEGFGTATPGSYTATPGAYEAETITIIAGWSVQPTLARKNAIDRFIKDLKAGRLSGTNVWNAIVRMLVVAQDEQSFLLPWKGSGSPTKLGAPVFSGVKGYRGPINQTDGYQDQLWTGLGLTVNSMVGIFMHQSAAAGNSTSINWAVGKSDQSLVAHNAYAWNIRPPTLAPGARGGFTTTMVGEATGVRVFINDIQVTSDSTTAGRAIPDERLMGSGSTVNQQGFMLMPAGNDNQIFDAINAWEQFTRAIGGRVA